MKKADTIKKESIVGDSLTVQKMTVTRGLNKGKGYSYHTVQSVKKDRRVNEEIQNLFLELIESRKSVINQ